MNDYWSVPAVSRWAPGQDWPVGPLKKQIALKPNLYSGSLTGFRIVEILIKLVPDL